ncbi:MAG: MFS transporter [Muribaculaceae bacterium]|nr:MFS transporter [Muribaculaceae bacterium]
MITFRGYVIIAINVGRTALVKVYNGAHLVWQKIKHLNAWFHSEGWTHDRGWFH